jgi:hypothetical protein
VQISGAGSQHINDAVPRILEAYEIVSKLGRAEGIAVIGAVAGQILAASKETERARAVLQHSAEMYRRLGRGEEASGVELLIQQLGLD